nr:uncharacterized protein LOC128694744 isoform X2 [Cherax quadricarinatus]
MKQHAEGKMTRLVLLLALPALSLAFYSYDDMVVEEVGPGCAEGFPYYPGIPNDIEDCPGIDPPDPVVQENLHDCSSYILCNDGDPYLICCPKDQYWDPPMSTCDDLEHVSLFDQV